MRRDIGNEVIVAIAVVAVIVFAVIFGIVLSLSNASQSTAFVPTRQPTVLFTLPASAALAPSPTALMLETPAVMPTNTQTPRPSDTPAPTNTNTPRSSDTPASTNTQTPRPSDTPAPTNTNTPRPSDTPAPTNTQTPRSSDTPSAPTNTNTPRSSDTPASTNTNTPRPSDTPAPTNTNTPRPSDTPAPTNTQTPRPSDTPAPTNTNTPRPSDTPAPTNTNTPRPSDTPAPTNTQTLRPTNTPIPTNTATLTPTASDTPRPPTGTPFPTRTPRPTLTPTSAEICATPPNWVSYTLAPSDTIYAVAVAASTSVSELRVGNCLDERAPRTGETIAVPRLPAQPVPTFAPVVPETLPPRVGCTFPGVVIGSPMPGEEVTGVFNLLGTANLNSFAFYRVEIRPESSSTFTLYARSETPVINGVLASINSDLYGDGLHWVRLTAVQPNSEFPTPCAIALIFR